MPLYIDLTGEELEGINRNLASLGIHPLGCRCRKCLDYKEYCKQPLPKTTGNP